MNVTDAFAGKEVDDYVFFLDIRGTTAKLLESWKSGDLLKRADFAHSQTHFISILGVLCKEVSPVEVVQVSDCAFLYSAELEHALDFSCAMFKHMTVRGDKFVPWSIRGGGGQGLNKFMEGDEIKAVKNLSFSSVIGVGNVQSSTLERRGPKGMRLFVTETVGHEALKLGRFQLRKTAAGDHSCFEVNWMLPDRIVPNYLDITKEGRTISEHLRHRAKLYSNSSLKHLQDLGRSWEDLLVWSQAA